jgi:hypothetical protein
MSRAAKILILLSVVVVAVGSAIPVRAAVVLDPATGHYYATNADLGQSAATFANAVTAAAGATLAACPGCTAHLVTITSLTENQFIGTNFAADFGFIGLYQPGVLGTATETEPGTPAQGAAGQWTWVTGEPFYQSATNTAADVIFENWRVATGEPNNGLGGGEEDAAEWAGVDTEGLLWNDVFTSGPNTVTQGYLVEFEPRTRTDVPEPGSMLLLGSALAGLGLLVKRRQDS